MLRLRVVLRHERAVGPEAREHRWATVFPVDDDRLADIRLDARDVDALAERLAGAGPDAADGEHAGHLAQRLLRRGRGRREAVLRRQRVVGAAQLVYRVAERRLQARG